MDHGAFAVFQGLDVAELYVRAYNGRSSRWYKAAMQQNAGRIEAAGLTRGVTFESSDNQVNHQIDDAYRAKYKSSLILGTWSAQQRVVRR